MYKLLVKDKYPQRKILYIINIFKIEILCSSRPEVSSSDSQIFVAEGFSKPPYF